MCIISSCDSHGDESRAARHTAQEHQEILKKPLARCCLWRNGLFGERENLLDSCRNFHNKHSVQLVPLGIVASPETPRATLDTMWYRGFLGKPLNHPSPALLLSPPDCWRLWNCTSVLDIYLGAWVIYLEYIMDVRNCFRVSMPQHFIAVITFLKSGSIADEVVKEEEMEIYRRKWKKVTRLKIGSKCKEDNSTFNWTVRI